MESYGQINQHFLQVAT